MTKVILGCTNEVDLSKTNLSNCNGEVYIFNET